MFDFSLAHTAAAMTRLIVRLTPRASRDGLDGFGPGGELRARVTAPPVDGAANAALVRLLAAALGLAPRDLVLEAGATSRTKRFRVPLEPEETRTRIEAAIRPPAPSDH